MASRFFNQATYTLEKAVVTLFGDVTIGAVGAPTLVAKNSKGFKSITRNGAGDYTVVFQDQYVKFLSFWIGFQKATVPAATGQSIKAVNMLAAGGATVNFVVYNNAGTATDPASGEELFIEFAATNSGAF